MSDHATLANSTRSYSSSKSTMSAEATPVGGHQLVSRDWCEQFGVLFPSEMHAEDIEGDLANLEDALNNTVLNADADDFDMDGAGKEFKTAFSYVDLVEYASRTWDSDDRTLADDVIRSARQRLSSLQIRLNQLATGLS